jgi:Ni/Co efflux regulator RcnB
MNKAIAVVLVGATLLSSTSAFAADHGNRGHGRGNDNHQWNGGSSHQWNGGNYRQGGDYRSGGHYRQGYRYPYYIQSRYVIRDYRSYRLPPPRYGYQYYRTDNGDIVMAAIASGIIGLIIGSAIADNHNDGYYNQGYGYAPPPQPYYPPAPYYPPPAPYYRY